MAAVPGIYYEIIACCPDFGTQITFFNSINGNILDGTYTYEGVNTVINGIQFREGYCYTVTNKGASFQNYPVIDNNLLGPIETNCNDPKCPPCPIYYTLNDCCTNEPINWPLGTLEGILYLEFDGSCNEGDFDNLPCPNDLTNLIITEISNEGAGGLFLEGCLKLTRVLITEIPNNADIANYTDIIQDVSTVTTCAECQECCYKLTNCQTNEVIYSNTGAIGQYFGNTVTLNGQEGCWQVALSDGICDCPIPVTVLQSFNDCPSCLPIIAYKFTNCNNQTLVQYSTEDYSEYVGKTVELECGECWSVSQIDYTPPSTQTITILYTFDSCLACNRTYYKLTDCLDPNNVTYTYTDLSSVIPPPVIGCDCIKVTYQLDGEEPVTVEVDVFGIIGGKNYYNLTIGDYDGQLKYMQGWTFIISEVGLQAILSEDTPCPFGVYYTGPEDSIFSAFSVTSCGSLPVIKIKGCSNCFTVEETRLPINAGIVELVDSFIDCPECLETFACVCNRITNQDTIAKDFTYIDCLFEEVTINLQPNETSDKVCLINWVLTPEEEALVYIEHFGNCVNGQCPAEPLPKRKVKPGYSTPSCDIEKYEKITCKASEYYYKQVMRLRYGISNCCPEDEEKWLIKKELIDLDALRDPDYICTPVTTCCNQPISSCGCECNQTLKSCNS